jgi:hypothetical protein
VGLPLSFLAILAGGSLAALALIWTTFFLRERIGMTVNYEYWTGLPAPLRPAYTAAIGVHAFWVALRASLGVGLAAAALWALATPCRPLRRTAWRGPCAVGGRRTGLPRRALLD